MTAELFPETLENLAARVVAENKSTPRNIAVAESCTGGLVSSAITQIAGSSAVFLAGYVTYSNEAKCDMLGLDRMLIAQHGAVSEQVAAAMASGALDRSGSDVAVSITGIAGPGGGSLEKPVGTVMFGLARTGAALQSHNKAFGDNQSRAEIRLAAAIYALELLLP